MTILMLVRENFSINSILLDHSSQRRIQGGGGAIADQNLRKQLYSPGLCTIRKTAFVV